MRDGICLLGSYGNRRLGNLGDEAVLEVLHKHLSRKWPGRPVTVLSESPDITSRKLGCVSVGCRPPGRPGHIAALLRSSVLVLGGGALLQDVYPPYRFPLVVAYYLVHVLLAKVLGCKLMMYGQGVGPLRKRLSRVPAGWCLQLADSITLRDRCSVEVVKRIGLPENRFRLTADPAFLVDPAASDEIDELLRSAFPGRHPGSHGRPLVGVGLRPWEQNGHVPAVAEGLSLLVDRMDADLMFIPAHCSTDIDVAEAVVMRMPPQLRERAYVLRMVLSGSQSAGLCARFTLALGMRLHFVLFCCLAGIPVAAIAYDPKVSDLMCRVGLQEAVMGLHDISGERVVETMLNLRRGAEEIRRTVTRTVGHLKRLAEENNDALDVLIAKSLA